MSLNALDILLLALVLVCLIIGLIKGLVREVIGIVAVVAGLLLAVHWYPAVGAFFHRFISSQIASGFLGFMAVFLGVVILGWLISLLISKLMKGPLAFLNHVLGGFFGLLKGVLICGILVFALLVFGVWREGLAGSRCAPYCYQVARAIVQIIPRDLKMRFEDAYKDLRGKGGDRGQKI